MIENIIISKIITTAFDKLIEKLDCIRFCDFSWMPDSPLTNSEANLFIKDHPKDMKLDFENNRISNELISGETAFVQHLIMFINTPNDEYKIYPRDYGNEQASTIFTVKNYTEFTRQCKYMAETILRHEHFKNYIQEIYSIKRIKNKLYIEIKLKGKPDTLKCEIPNLLKNTRKRNDETKV